QEVEFLLEDAVELFAELLIEIRHLPAAELEALGRILGLPAGRLHDAIHRDHGADDNLPHGSLSLFEPRTNDLCAPHVRSDQAFASASGSDPARISGGRRSRSRARRTAAERLGTADNMGNRSWPTAR